MSITSWLWKVWSEVWQIPLYYLITFVCNVIEINRYHNSYLIYRFRFIIKLEIYYGMRFLLTYLTPNEHTIRYLMVDLSTIYEVRNISNLLYSLSYLAIAYAYRVLYFSYCPSIIVKMLVPTLITFKPSYFLYASMRCGSKQILVCSMILLNYQLCFAMLQFFQLFTCLYIMYTPFLTYQVAKRNYNFFFANQTFLLSCFKVTIHWLDSVAVSCVLFTWGYVINCVSIFYAITLMAFTKFAQIRRLLKWKTKPSSIRLNRVMRHHTQTLGDVLSFNNCYSTLLLLFLLVTVPINIFCVNCFFTTSLIGFHRLALLIVICCQFSGLFLLHLGLAIYTIQIHQEVPQYLGRLHATHHFRSLCTHIKMACFFERIHTKNRYGITYGKMFGLVSLKAFAWYLMLYSRLLLTTFKRLK